MLVTFAAFKHCMKNDIEQALTFVSRPPEEGHSAQIETKMYLLVTKSLEVLKHPLKPVHRGTSGCILVDLMCSATHLTTSLSMVSSLLNN